MVKEALYRFKFEAYKGKQFNSMRWKS